MPIWPVATPTSRAAVAKLREGFTEEDWRDVIALAIAIGDKTHGVTRDLQVRKVAAAFWLLGLYAADQATRPPASPIALGE